MSLKEKLTRWLAVVPLQKPDELYREAEEKEADNQQEVRQVRLEYLAELKAILDREDEK